MKRIIPVLLLKDGGLVKSIKFKNHRYIGDPINAVKIFNEKEVDEIILLDIDASKKGLSPNLQMIAEIASEAFMPLAYGGGIRTIEQVKEILYQGVEKVVFNTSVFVNPQLIAQTAKKFGSSSTVVSLDVKKSVFGKYYVKSHAIRKEREKDLVKFAVQMEDLGAGEIFLNSIERDGTFSGYDVDLIRAVSEAVQIPVIACGGAKDLNDLANAVNQGKASAAAAGSLFVYQNQNRAVLINYPEWDTMQETIKNLER